MGKHSRGTQNYRLSKELVAILVLVALAIGAVVLWSGQRIRSNEQHVAQTCFDGDLELPVATHGVFDADSIIKRFNEASLVVRDRCVHAKLIDDPAKASLLLSAETNQTIEDVLARAGRTASNSEYPIIAEIPVGVAQPPAANDAAGVTYPTSPDAVASAVLASLGASDTQQVYNMLERFRGLDVQQVEQGGKPAATSEGILPEGWTFLPKQPAVLPLRAVVMNQHGDTTEDQLRAADAVAKEFARPEAPGLSATVTQALDMFGSKLQTTERTNDTLFLLDTSAATAPWAEVAHAAVAEAVQGMADVRNAALMNYSSPLSAGATKGWRENVGFADNVPISQAVRALGTGGVPQTHEALLRALEVARAHGKPTTIVLITSGSVDDQPVAEALKNAKDAGVRVALVHVGDNLDAALAKDVNNEGGEVIEVQDPKDLTAAVHRAAGLA